MARNLDNQLAKTDIELPIQRIAIAVIAMGLAILLGIFGWQRFQASDPYIQAVLTSPGDPVQGHAIFQINCAGCHGLEADGRIGPSLKEISTRKSRVSLIQQVISGKTPPMPKFQPSPQTMADLLEYLEKL